MKKEKNREYLSVYGEFLKLAVFWKSSPSGFPGVVVIGGAGKTDQSYAATAERFFVDMKTR
jgi:hypothetical protein